MELYHSKGDYLLLGVHPYGSDLEEAIAQTAVQPLKPIHSRDHHYITPANIMFELIWCHCKGNHQDWSSAPLPVEGISGGIWFPPPCGAGAEEPAGVNTLLPNSVSGLAWLEQKQHVGVV